MATMQFALRDIVSRIFSSAIPRSTSSRMRLTKSVDIVGENYDVAIRAHSDPLPDSTLVQRTLTPAPWLLFAGSAYLDANERRKRPKIFESILRFS